MNNFFKFFMYVLVLPFIFVEKLNRKGWQLHRFCESISIKTGMWFPFFPILWKKMWRYYAIVISLFLQIIWLMSNTNVKNAICRSMVWFCDDFHARCTVSTHITNLQLTLALLYLHQVGIVIAHLTSIQISSGNNVFILALFLIKTVTFN